MKRTLITLMLLAVITACKKKDDPAPAPPPPPAAPSDPYTHSSDLESSVDIVFVLQAITDLQLMMGYVSEQDLQPQPFLELNGTGTAGSQPTFVRDHTMQRLSASFNKTICNDGKKRDGMVQMKYTNLPHEFDSLINNPSWDPNSNYYREPMFTANFFLSQFTVNQWNVEIYNWAKIRNKTPFHFDPATTDIYWELNGGFKFTKGNHVITWTGTLTTVLSNTDDQAAHDPQKGIDWNKAQLHYSCNAAGTIDGKPYTCVVKTSQPLVRDPVCNAQPAGQTPAPVAFHPFISGTVDFKYDNFHPRTIDLGPGTSCDNAGIVSFAKEQHAVDFR